ncbi:hypothetical protein E2C01_047653 [Portunus trituberculatus]|uniref:Uncharacterized protein n=1 Tax=Portunus trituberculatus TaxID=210409 RepID=A0A5B7GB44_PORTR|nr:hypothetical protein [Portunus trituberculatus]
MLLLFSRTPTALVSSESERVATFLSPTWCVARGRECLRAPTGEWTWQSYGREADYCSLGKESVRFWGRGTPAPGWAYPSVFRPRGTLGRGHTLGQATPWNEATRFPFPGRHRGSPRDRRF